MPTNPTLDHRCAQGKETLRQRHKRIRREFAECCQLERALGPIRYQKFLEGTNA
jgi:hypothetical protein